MIEQREGDILRVRDAQALVNPVNCVGRMGRGLARQFATAYPAMLREYEALCRAGKLRPGRAWLHEAPSRNGWDTKWIVSFPTKDHWRDPSRMEWIRDGMADLMRQLEEREAGSMAVPYLGAGLGGLNPKAVETAIREEADRWPDIRTILMSRRR